MNTVNLAGKTCAIYTRVSSKSQVLGTSLEDQEYRCVEFAKANKMKIMRIYSESASAMTPCKRPRFNEMLDVQSTNSKVDVIIFATVDRMTRNYVDYYRLREKIESSGLILAFVKENVFP